MILGKTLNLKCRSDLIIEISYLINCLKIKGTNISFCWIPSHCGFYYNEKVDKAAKCGAKYINNAKYVSLPFSLQECYYILNSTMKNDLKKYQEDLQKKESIIMKQVCHFSINSLENMNNNAIKLAYRWKLNSFRNKYNTKVKCVCSFNTLTHDHILNCVFLKRYLP